MIIPSAAPIRAATFDQAPIVVLWELTRACALACLHCRAEAEPRRRPEELTTDEARAVLEDIRGFGTPIVVLTGGDPATRPDLLSIIAHGSDLGLKMALTPSATPRTTPERLRQWQEAGLSRVAFSLDAATEAEHDAFRGVPGSYSRTLSLLRAASDIGLGSQINTTVTRANACRFEEMAESVLAIAEESPIDLWSVFFLVPTGRASVADVPTAKQCERVFEVMAEAAEAAPFAIKATEAPHYRRFLLQRRGGLESSPNRLGVRDADGVVFVSYRGDVYPSGFMPTGVGNVRETPLTELYRGAPLFKQLRDPDLFGGKCGRCEYRDICGGSRARAYALTGDPLGSEPCCTYLPTDPMEELC